MEQVRDDITILQELSIVPEYKRLEIALSINSDEIKIQALEKLKNFERVELARTITSDEIKLKAMRWLVSYNKLQLLKTIDDDNIKLQEIDKFRGFVRVEIAKLIRDDNIKLQALDKFIGRDKLKVAKTIKNDEIKIKAIDKVQEKSELAGTIENEVQRNQLLREIDKLNETIKIEDDTVKIEELRKFEDKYKIEIAKSIKDDNLKLKLLEQFEGENKNALIRTIRDPEIMLIALEQLDGIDKKHIEILKKLYLDNNEIMQYIDFRILDEKYLNTLGEDKISLISCYPEIQLRILALPAKSYDLFVKCLNKYLERANTDEWTTIAYKLLENIQTGQYEQLIENIEDVDGIDLSKLSIIMQSDNTFEIKNVQDIERFEEIKKRKCDEIMEGQAPLIEKKNALLQKIFGISIEYAEDIINAFGNDIGDIEDGDEKDFVLSLISIMEIENEQILKQVYAQCEQVAIIDITHMQRRLKTSYGKLFNEGLYEPSEKKRIPECDLPEELKGVVREVYDAGIDFRMIITSVSAYVKESSKNFKEDWNRSIISSQHFCTSYIRNDMQGTATIPNLCYGFIKMKEDSLLLSNTADIFVKGRSFVPEYSKKETYRSPNQQINETEYYNEMDYRRIQGGKKKQPDYIVAFKRNGKILGVDNIVKAFNDWGKTIPIVIIDQDRCLQVEREKVIKMLEEYERNKTPEIARAILQKVRNNRATDNDGLNISTFCADLNEQLKNVEEYIEGQTYKKAEGKKVTLEDMQENDARVNVQGRKKAESLIRRVRETIEEIRR